MEGVLLETENMLARGRMDLPLSLCFATLRGDDLLLHHLLKRGLDPNESDNTGRTPLVSTTYILIAFEKFHRNFLAIIILQMMHSDFVSCMCSQHIAAANGNENCVLLLLDYGADPNARGNSYLNSTLATYPRSEAEILIWKMPLNISFLYLFEVDLESGSKTP